MQTFDCETGMDVELLNLNPEGWIQGVSNERNWGMLYGMDVCAQRNLVIAGDTHGYLHFVDPRTSARISQQLVHKKTNKVSPCPAVMNAILQGQESMKPIVVMGVCWLVVAWSIDLNNGARIAARLVAFKMTVLPAASLLFVHTLSSC